MNDNARLNELLIRDPEDEKEYELTKPGFELMLALIDARHEANITQKELAERSGVRQSNISRIEVGACSPTVATLQRLAMAMGKTLHIEIR